MSNIYSVLKQIIRDFFINHFWKKWQIIVILILTVGLNVFLWYTFETKIKDNSSPFLFSSGVAVINLILANYLFNREKIASYILITIGLSIQILMLLFVRYLIVVF
jgi:hypothetical protein